MPPIQPQQPYQFQSSASNFEQSPQVITFNSRSENPKPNVWNQSDLPNQELVRGEIYPLHLSWRTASTILQMTFLTMNFPLNTCSIVSVFRTLSLQTPIFRTLITPDHSLVSKLSGTRSENVGRDTLPKKRAKKSRLSGTTTRPGAILMAEGNVWYLLQFRGLRSRPFSPPSNLMLLRRVSVGENRSTNITAITL